jgi:hypothetical protein
MVMFYAFRTCERVTVRLRSVRGLHGPLQDRSLDRPQYVSLVATFRPGGPGAGNNILSSTEGKGMTSNDTKIKSEPQPRRRTLLGVMAATSGLFGSTGTTAAQPGDDVEPRPCDDSHLFQPGDWAESAITVGTCSNAPDEPVRLHVDVSEQIGNDRSSRPGRGSYTTVVHDQETLWYNGEITRLQINGGDANVAIAHRE